jgi:soluble lytic murein transglycosylase-like protein
LADNKPAEWALASRMGPREAVLFQTAPSGPAQRLRWAAACRFTGMAGTPEGDRELLSAAVEQARRARATGIPDQTIELMRGVLDRVRQRGRRQLRIWICGLCALLALTVAYGYWRLERVRVEKAAIDGRVNDLENRLTAASPSGAERERLIADLSGYEDRAEALSRNALYRVGARDRESDLIRAIRALMAEFGAESYSVPPDFAERVRHYIVQYQGPDRPHMARALDELGATVQIVRGILAEEKLPPDLAYMPLVESALAADRASAAGAAGIWQLTAPTARACGLRVDDAVDQRLQLRPATRAACRYLRSLILDFGAGSSVMLALAAYDSGPSRVKQAIAKTVQDPIRQRNFWYLYRARALPLETREYVPKVFAAVLIGRDPRRFGFQ